MKLLPDTIHQWFKVPHSLNLKTLRRVRRARAAALFIHGLGNTGASWGEVIDQLPKDIQIYSVDLLGFGDSPKPSWAKYDARAQAQSLAVTMIKLRNRHKLIVAGHSLGALVGIELAKLYPGQISQLLLCSPPLYKTGSSQKVIPTPDEILIRLYERAMSRPDKFLALAAFAMKHGLAQSSFNVTAENFDSYRRTLKAAIINQTSLEDAESLQVPVRIIFGKLDPLVVVSNFRALARKNKNVKVKSIIAGHEVTGNFVGVVVRQLEQMIDR